MGTSISLETYGSGFPIFMTHSRIDARVQLPVFPETANKLSKRKIGFEARRGKGSRALTQFLPSANTSCGEVPSTIPPQGCGLPIAFTILVLGGC